MYPQSRLIKLRTISPSSTGRIYTLLGTRFFRFLGLVALIYSIFWSVSKLPNLLPVPFFTEEFRKGLYAELHPATNAIPKAIWQLKSPKDPFGLSKLKTGQGAASNAVIAGVLGGTIASPSAQSVQQGAQSTKASTQTKGAHNKPTVEALPNSLPKKSAKKDKAHGTVPSPTQSVAKKQPRRTKTRHRHEHHRKSWAHHHGSAVDGEGIGRTSTSNQRETKMQTE